MVKLDVIYQQVNTAVKRGMTDNYQWIHGEGSVLDAVRLYTDPATQIVYIEKHDGSNWLRYGIVFGPVWEAKTYAIGD